LVPSVTYAHDFLPGVLALEETEANVYRFSWTPPVDSGQSMPVQIEFPCKVTDDVVDCRSGELKVEFPGLADQRVLMSVVHLDGRREESSIPSPKPLIGLAALQAAIAILLLSIARRSLGRFPKWVHPLAYAIGTFASYLLIRSPGW
jgi:hypothetical protein